MIATSQVGYYEEIAAVRNGTAQTRPAEEIVQDWPERLAAARTLDQTVTLTDVDLGWLTASAECPRSSGLLINVTVRVSL